MAQITAINMTVGKVAYVVLTKTAGEIVFDGLHLSLPPDVFAALAHDMASEMHFRGPKLPDLAVSDAAGATIGETTV